MAFSRFVLAASVSLIAVGYHAVPSVLAQNQQPTFRAGTTLVEVDVVVRDASRRFVADLRPEDFEVLDDGVRQDLSVFYRVVGPGELPNVPVADTPSVPLPPPQEVQRILVFYFDPHHIQPGAFDRARNAALQFLEKDFREGDVGGVVVNGKMANGRLTSSGEELSAALKSAKPEAAASVTRELREWPRFVDIMEAYQLTRRAPAANPGPTVLDDVVERACRDRPEDCRGPGRAAVEAQAEAKATQLVANERIASRQVLESLSALANGLARLPGRKTVILLTEGFFVENALPDVQVVVARAARASVRIYALDTRGLNRGSAGSDILSSESTSRPGMSAPSTDDLGADAPNSLAVDTGGYVIRNENDFGKAFTEIDRDTSSYYIVGFRTSRPPDEKFHELTVRVKRARRVGSRAQGLRRIEGTSGGAHDCARGSGSGCTHLPALPARRYRRSHLWLHRPQAHPKPRLPRRRPPSAPRREARRRFLRWEGASSRRARVRRCPRSSGSRRLLAGRPISRVT